MSVSSDEEYDDLKKTLQDTIKKILNYETSRSLPSDKKERESRINEYKIELVENYNKFVSHIASHIDTLKPEVKLAYTDAVKNIKFRILRALTVLSLKTDIPDKLDEIDIDLVVDINAVDPSDNTQIFVTASSSSSSQKSPLDSPDLNKTFRETTVESFSEQNSLSFNNTDLQDDLDQNKISSQIELNTDITLVGSTPSDPLAHTNSREAEDELIEMSITLSDIFRGINNLTGESQEEIKKFIADAEMMYALCADAQKPTVLTVIKNRLSSAGKLGDISALTWDAIKERLRNKYRPEMSYETAQERLLSIVQGPKESIDAYAGRVKKLLEVLNTCGDGAEANVRAAQMSMNESLAIRKFKQNIYEETVRKMAINAEHSDLYAAISHATQKLEQLKASNIRPEQKSNDSNVSNKSNANVANNANNANNSNSKGNSKSPNGSAKKNNSSKTFPPCTHCERTNHSSERCFFKKKQPNESQGNNGNGNGNNRSTMSAANDFVGPSNASVANAQAATYQMPQNEAELHPFHGKMMTVDAKIEHRAVEKADTLPVPPEIHINRISTVANLETKNNDLTIDLCVSICRGPVKFLIDCGSHATMIRSECLKPNVLYYPQVKYCLTGINGPTNPVKTHGATYGNLSFNGIKFKHQLQIAGNEIYMNYDGIIGLDFLSRYSAILNLRSNSLNLLLPAHHELYEAGEREIFENSEHVAKKYEQNELIYFKNGYEAQALPNTKTEIKIPNAKKNVGNEIGAGINRLQLQHISNNPLKKVKLLPHSQKNFKIHTDKPILCKAKIFGDYVFSPDTLITDKKNVISVYNASDDIVELNEFKMETECLENFNVFTIKKSSNADQKSRVDFILKNLKMSHCTENEKIIIKQLVEEYNDVFQVDGDGLTFAKVCEHKILTKPDANPINTKQYRIPHGQKEIVDLKIKEMLRDGVIEHCTSIWNSPLLVVPKKSPNGQQEYRFCIDFKNLNKITETETYPMPNLEEELSKMYGAKIFSTMDIQSAFHQIKLREEDREKTAFTYCYRKYQFTRMPFGLKGSPITWQQYVTQVLGEMLSKNVMAYMDDILSYSKTTQGHTETLREIFNRLRHFDLKLRVDKTVLFAKEIKYLGHIINEKGIQPDKANVEAVKNFPTPKNLKQLQRFLGMASYFRKFIRKFAMIAASLHALCRKNIDFVWTAKENIAFETLKTALITAPVLVFPNFGKTFYISVDASDYAVGAYISNEKPPNDRPIEYYSKALTAPQRNYSTTHKELLAIILAIEKFQHYIWGKHFVLYTDHQALTYLFSQNKVGSRLLRWKILLAEYDFDIIHRKGKNNVVSDCLSRIGEQSKEVQYFDRIKNPIMRTILVATTRSRARENELIQNELRDKHITQKYHINEEPNVTLDSKKYDKIYFITDDQSKLAFKKFQLKLKRKFSFDNNAFYTLNSIDDTFRIILLPKILFKIEKLESQFEEVLHECDSEKLSRIAINLDVSNYRTLAEIKAMFAQVFRNSETSTTFHLCTQMEIVEVEHINELLRTYHSSLLGGHRGFERMKNSLKRFFKWATMDSDIKKFISECSTCEKSKIKRHTHTPLQITSVANFPFEKIYIDFVGEINPNSELGHKHLMTISCDLSKYIIMIPTFDCTALTAAKNIVEHVCLVYNIPKIIVSDNGAAFVAEIFKQVMKLLNIDHIRTTPYHPQSNGGIERYHRTMGEYVRSYVQQNPASWHKYVPFFTFSYNNTVHSTTGYSPHSLIFGFDIELPTSIRNARDYNYDSYKHELIVQLQSAQKRAKEMIEKRKIENKKSHDTQKHQALKLKVDDSVLLKKETKNHKFDVCYTGPYKVTEIVSPAVTKIKKGNKIVTVHNDKLKVAEANYD